MYRVDHCMCSPSIAGHLLDFVPSGHPALDSSCHTESTQPRCLYVATLSLQFPFRPKFYFMRLYQVRSPGPRPSLIDSLQYSLRMMGFLSLLSLLPSSPWSVKFLKFQRQEKNPNLGCEGLCLLVNETSKWTSTDYRP